MTDYLRSYQKYLLKQIELSLQEVNATGNSKGIVLIGDSGVGKTHIFDKIAQRYAPWVDGNQRMVPSFRLSVSANEDSSSQVRKILRQLGRPVHRQKKLTKAKAEEMLYDGFATCETYLGMFEEFHNGLLKSTAAIGKQNAQFLKDVWNLHDPDSPRAWTSPLAGEPSKGMLLIVSGTPEMQAAFFSDGELLSRFNAVVMAEKVSLFPQEALVEYQYVVRSMAKRFLLPKTISANDMDLIARLYFATIGHLRLLQHLFQRAATLLKELPSDQVPHLELLALAAAQVLPPGLQKQGFFKMPANEIARLVEKERLRYESRR